MLGLAVASAVCWVIDEVAAYPPGPGVGGTRRPQDPLAAVGGEPLAGLEGVGGELFHLTVSSLLPCYI